MGEVIAKLTVLFQLHKGGYPEGLTGIGRKKGKKRKMDSEIQFIIYLLNIYWVLGPGQGAENIVPPLREL